MERGLAGRAGLLVVLDGAKGLRKAVHQVFGAQAAGAALPVAQAGERRRATCPKSRAGPWRRKLQAAYDQPTYAEAQARSSAAPAASCGSSMSRPRASLEEGLEETLTLHRLGVFRELGISLKTTNCLESLNSLVEQRVAKVDRWRTSDQKQRWLAAALLDIEPRLRRIKGFRALLLLRQALLVEFQVEKGTATIQAA